MNPLFKTPLSAQFDGLAADWRALLAPFCASAHYAALCHFVDGEHTRGKTIYPHDVFHALHLTPPDSVQVVILGQDPYHGEDHGIPQAHGLAFSVPPGVRPPPSLRNIFKEIAAEFGTPPARFYPYGCLESWARQGVLLLNAVLTVERNRPGSHAKRGWEHCTDTLIQRLAARREGLVFMLWGAYAQAKRTLIDASRHIILEAPHPSPLSAARGFFSCHHFVQANEYLTRANRPVIDWQQPMRML